MVRVVLLLVFLLLNGCAMLFTGDSDSIEFVSKPAGATIYIDGFERGKTPDVIEVKRDIEDVEVLIKKKGFKDRVIVLRTEFNMVSILNLGNMIFWGVDVLTGAVKRFDPKYYSVELEPQLTLNLQELTRASDGAYLLPAGASNKVVVKDDENEFAFVLHR